MSSNEPDNISSSDIPVNPATGVYNIIGFLLAFVVIAALVYGLVQTVMQASSLFTS